MKKLAIFFILTLLTKPSYSQKWNSLLVGKPESRALYASNVAKSIQHAWENELSSKGNKEMLLDEIIFGQNSEPKQIDSVEVNKPMMSNIDEIEELLGIEKERIIDPVKKKKVEIPVTAVPPKAVIPVEPEEVTAMGNVDEVKEALKSLNAIPTKTENTTDTKTSLTINNNDIDADSVYAVPEISPVFQGGQNAMKNFFARNIITPESEGRSVKGKVFIRFMVKKDGELTKIHLVKGLSDACNREAIRVIKKMPAWQPAQQEGQKVNSWYTLPIYFEIN